MGHTSLPDTISNCEVESARVSENNGCGLDTEGICEAIREKAYGEELGDEKTVKCENGQASITQSHGCPINGDVIEEKMANGVEIEAKAAAKKDVFALNAKIRIEDDPTLSATAGWQAARAGGDADFADTKVASYVSSHEENSEFNLEEDGSLPFYILDAHEEFYGANIGTLYLFGKVKAGQSYQSCCVVVKNMQRCVYAIPNRPLHYTDDMVKLEKDVEEGRITATDFHKKLQVSCFNF